MKIEYLYIHPTVNGGYLIRRNIPGAGSKEGLQYIGYTERNAIKQFRQDFDCKGKHFTKIYI